MRAVGSPAHAVSRDVIKARKALARPADCISMAAWTWSSVVAPRCLLQRLVGDVGPALSLAALDGDSLCVVFGLHARKISLHRAASMLLQAISDGIGPVLTE